MKNLRLFLTFWWPICAFVNLSIYTFHHQHVELWIGLFSSAMFIRSFNKLLDKDYNSGTHVCDRLVDRERNRKIQVPPHMKLP